MDTFAGKDAKSCGVELGDDRRDEGNECAVEAFLAGEPFTVSFDAHGIDSRVVTGIAGDGTPAFRQYTYDADVSGGGGSNPQITVATCPNGGTVKTNGTPEGGTNPSLMDGTRFLACETGSASVELCD